MTWPARCPRATTRTAQKSSFARDASAPRRLTPRECARLMGFDAPGRSDFRIPVSDTQAYKQFGNAVAVPAVEAVARHMEPHIREAVAGNGRRRNPAGGGSVPDIVDSATRSRMMAGIRSTNTRPEIAIRKALHAAGFRYRLHPRNVPGKPTWRFPAIVRRFL